MRIFEIYLAGYALTSFVVWMGMWQGRRRRVEGEKASLFAMTCVALGVSVAWPLFVLVLVVKLFIRKKKGPEFPPMMGAKEAEELRRAVAQRAADRVRVLQKKGAK